VSDLTFIILAGTAPDLCVTALKIRWQQQDADRAQAGDGWGDTGLVFTTRHGTPIEVPAQATRDALRKSTISPCSGWASG
jgi:hypothetical protein